MSSKLKLDEFKKLLDESYEYPCPYLFKFIVPHEKIEELKKMIGHAKTSTRESGKGKYISLTAEKVVNSSQEIMQIYQEVSRIEGIISL